MKQLKNCVSAVLFLLCCFSAGAQNQKIPLNEPDHNKPKLFADLPERMEISVAQLESLFRYTPSTKVSVQLSKELTLEGTVVSTSNDAAVNSIVIRSSNRDGAVFSFTKSVSKGQTYYLGRVISRAYGDALEIVQEKNRYVLIKKDFYDLIAE
jgi:hypothetical protein